MEILIGMDEAGYGPNLGPLAVAATAWRVESATLEDTRPLASASSAPAKRPRRGSVSGKSGAGAVLTAARGCVAREPDLYRTLRKVVAKSASERRIAIADSKALYQSGAGLRQLERGVHAILHAMNRSMACWSALLDHMQADRDGHHRAVCWPDGHDSPLPVDAAADELPRLGAKLKRACEDAGVRPLVIRARLVFPAEFNELVEHFGSKGAALSHVTVGLLREVMDAVCVLANFDQRNPPAEASSPAQSPASSSRLPIFAVCDKHGGRNFYAALLQHHFSEHWIEPVFESRAESRYEWGPADARCRVAFRTNGETFLPTALASMTAKYLRELSMRAFNAFWCAQVPDLKPTAGYYNDAMRFKKDIAAAQRRLRIEDRLMWRIR